MTREITVTRRLPRWEPLCAVSVALAVVAAGCGEDDSDADAAAAAHAATAAPTSAASNGVIHVIDAVLLPPSGE